MVSFNVSHVVDGDTFDVSEGCRWNGQSGARVRAAGYDAPELQQPGGEAAKSKLSRLVLGKQVELRQAHRLDRGRLVADVYLDGRHLEDYFSEY
ncbi:MAG: thermonuclease family protein [Planctomycetota bacterium]